MVPPKISVVTPSYNQAQFLEETIRSVLDQGYPNLEYIIIDGGSTDGSVEIIRKYENRLAYWISEPDRGQSHALNKGFRRCTGDIVGWQNSDDTYCPGAFQKVAKAFLRDPHADVVFGNRLTISSKGKLIRRSCYAPFSLLTYIAEGSSIANQAAFWKRSLLERYGGVDESLRYAMDYEFFLRLALRGAKFRFLHESLGKIRRHDATKTSRHAGGAQWQQEHEIIMERHGLRRSRFHGVLRAVSIARRAAYYVQQGDVRYLTGGFRRRVLKRRNLTGGFRRRVLKRRIVETCEATE